MRPYRLNRLFDARSGRCLDVAVDHGMFGEASFLAGIEDLGRAVDVLCDAGPDAIQLSPGQAHLLGRRRGRSRPSLVLRTDVANVYGTELPERLFSRLLPEAALAAVQLDAVCAVVNLLDLPGQPALREACVENVLRLRAECTRYGMPLMVEPLAMRPNAEAGGYQVDGDPQRIVPLVRQAAELGADVIKADPTDDVRDYGRVVEAAGVPVLVRGGGRVGDRELFERTAGVLARGAAGIVYGRNIVQHQAPARITRALMAMLHEDASVEHALALVGEAG